MGGEKKHKCLTVAPFECVWHEELRFKEAGRGCVAFEAFAQNDVTLVFREHVGSQHYHYKMDRSPNYTVVLGSHRNQRLKIEVDGKAVVDVTGIGLCNSSAFESYWICVFDGLISIGKGRHPFQDLVFQWMDPKRDCNVRYVGLSSWDKHVGYRNVNILSLTQSHSCLWGHFECKDYKGVYAEDWEHEDPANSFDEWGPANFLECWDLADMFFVVDDGRKVPAHKIILCASGTFDFSPEEDIINLPLVKYPVLHAFLEYIYTGKTQIIEAQLCSLLDLCEQFQVVQLMKQCKEIVNRLRTNKNLDDSSKKVELSYLGSCDMHHGKSSFELPMNHQRFLKFLKSPKYSDVETYIADYGFVASAHRIILSLWSAPFAKMFTNGMIESNSSEIMFGDIPFEAFEAMLQFMYSGQIDYKGKTDAHILLVQLLLLADQFGIAFLLNECSKILSEDLLSEDNVCYVLQAVATLPSCKLLEEACQRKFSVHFDYCTTASTEFKFLEEETFANILKHPDLTVTSEERVLNAILVWCMQPTEAFSWEMVDDLLKTSSPELLFQERSPAIYNLLSFVRFPLIPPSLLEKLSKSIICSQIPVFRKLVMEATQYLEIESIREEGNLDVRFQHRRSSFKELRYLRDGDDNGVMYFAGTSYGKHPWMNPVLLKKIKVISSTPPFRYTDAKALVSRSYQGTSFTGPRREDGQCCAWWMMDLGQDHQLMCNYYTLRQDGSCAYIRSWALQGSSNGKKWSNLRVHQNDQTICMPGQFSSWPVHGNAAFLPFRFFRIIMTSPTADLSNPWNLSICFMELYGFFR